MKAVIMVAMGMWEYVISSIQTQRGKIGVGITGRSIVSPGKEVCPGTMDNVATVGGSGQESLMFDVWVLRIDKPEKHS
jgi:hypothetical protein